MQERSRAQLALLATSHGMNHAYQLLTPIIIPQITADYKLSNFTAGILLSCFVLSYSLLPVLAGYLSRIFSRKLLLTLGFAVSAFTFLVMGFVDNIAIFALLLFIAGAGGSTYHPNGISILAETCPTSRGQTLGLHQTGGAIGSFVAPVVAGVLVLSYTWRPTLMLFAIPGIVLAVILWFSISPEQPRDKSNTKQASRTGRFNMEIYGSAIILIIAAFIFALGQRGTDAFANQYFTYGRGIQNFLEASLLFATLKAAGLFSAPLCGRLSDIYNRKKVLIALVIIESVSLYAITVTPTTLLAAPCLVFGFASFGLLAVSDALLADITPEEYRSTLFGANVTVSFTSTIFLSPILGSIADLYSFDVGFILLSALMPLSILFILKVKTKPAQQNKNT